MDQLTETIKTTPIQAEKSVRGDEIRGLTSAKPGRIIPLKAIPVLREDRVATSRIKINFEMMETAERLMNAISVVCHAYFVPFLAFERFEGSLDQLNRSYKGQPQTEGGAVVPFFETIAYDRTSELMKTLGLHAKDAENINSAYIEAYNVMVNHRRQARSTKLPVRLKDDTTLAEAFWRHTTMGHIVPDFDQAMIDGEVELNLVGKLPVSGLGIRSTGNNFTPGRDRNTAEGEVNGRWSDDGVLAVLDDNADDLPDIFAELNAANIKLSLANIEMAKQTAAFARMRKNYAGLDDDHIIDLLMEGIRVPDVMMAQPMRLDTASTIFGYNQRYATDFANLDKSHTNGETMCELTLRTPPMNTGGIILITAEIVPEQMFERQMDHFLYTTDPADLPDFTRDFLDPEKVAVVPNKHVDVEHSTPDATFGYAPLNYQWKRSLVNIGGKYHRQIGDPFVEDRQKLWSVETTDPELTSDFYLVNEIHQNVFADTVSDPFEINSVGYCNLIGNTVFGKGLHENTDDYETLQAEVDTGRIDQDA